MPRDYQKEYEQMVEAAFISTSEYEKIIAVKNKAAAQQGVQLTALRRGLAVSLLFNVVLLAVVLAIIGGN